MKLPKISLPESRRARIGVAAGSLVALTAIVAGGFALASNGERAGIDEVSFESDEARAEIEGGAATEEVLAEFRSLEPYETMTPAELAAALEQARAAGRLIGEGFTVANGKGEPLPDEMFASYLVIGSDASGRRADVLIYLIEPEDGARPMVVSIPRDIYLESPCTKELVRINANLNGCGETVNGPTLVALAVEDYTGIKVDHFATVDFAGFERIIDSFGGIEICFDAPTRDLKSKLDAPAGCTVATGEEVLAFVRSRRPEHLIDGEWVRQPATDFTRQAHQQEVIWTLAETIASFESLDQLIDAAGAFQGALALDSQWTFMEAIQVAYDHREFTLDGVTRLEPTFDDYLTQSGAAVLVPTATFTEVLIEAYPAAGE